MDLSTGTPLSNQARQVGHSLTNLNWDLIAQHAVNRLFSIILTVITFAVILWIGKGIINLIFKQTRRIQVLGGQRRAATFHALTLNIYRYTCYFFLLYALLSLIGVPVGTLLAGAGIFSIALGLGAQGFVSDVVNGFFILLEKQVDVGDVVKIGTVKGRVAAVGLRTTQVLAGDGTLTYIQNRNIAMVQNFSRHDLTANVDLWITPATPLDRLKETVLTTNRNLAGHLPDLVKTPTIAGPTTDAYGHLVYRVVITATPGKQDQVAAACLAAYLKNLAAAKVPLDPGWGQHREH